MQDREEKTEQQLQETIQAADEQPILISDACKQLNMEAHVLRYWEEELGLPIMRNDQGYRCYTNAQLLMFQRIKILRDAGYQLKAIKLVVPRLALLDDDEFYYLVKLSDEMNKRASELPDTLPAILPVSASQTELARKLRMEEFEDVMNRILDEALCRHSADVNAQLADTICEKIGVQLDNVIAEKITEQVSTKVIKEMDYRMRLQDDEAEERFRKLDETLFMRRKSHVNKRRLPRAGCHGKENIRRKKKDCPLGQSFFLTVNKLFVDCAYWTCSCAASALDACVCVDLVLAFALCDCTYWALTLTCTTHNTLITNLVCHLFFLLGNNI